MSKSQGSGSKTVQDRAPSVPGAHPVTLEVLEGPMDGARLVGRFERVKIGRSAGNDLALALDRSVSGEHALLRWDGGAWLLEDHRSTNGTWLASGRLQNAQPVPADGLFVAGHAVVRIRNEADGSSYLPTADALKGEVGRLRDRLAPAAARAWGAAVALAIGEGSLFVTDRHLLRGAAMTSPELLPLGGADDERLRSFLTETLQGTSQYAGDRSWIGQLLQAAAWSGEIFFEADVAPTPRLLAVLAAADEVAAEAGGQAIELADVLSTLWAPGSRICELAAEAGVKSDAVRKHVTGAAPPRSAAPATAAAPAPVAALPLASSGDPAVDRRAREAARGLHAMAALYQLAQPDERQHALKQYLSREAAQLPPGQRTLLLEQLQRLFPVSVGSTHETTELVRLKRQVTQLEEALTGAGEESQGPAPLAAAWRAVLGEGKSPQTNLEGSDAAAVELLTDVFAFATSLENFIVGTVHNLTTQGAGTDVVHLPGFRTSIRRIAHKVLADEAVRREDLQEYLEAVERWLLVVTAAYHEGPRVWFEEFWNRVNPAAVEAKLSDAGWKRKLGVESIEFWNYYKEMVHAVTPDLVSDEILRVVRRRAEEHFARLREGRRPS